MACRCAGASRPSVLVISSWRGPRRDGTAHSTSLTTRFSPVAYSPGERLTAIKAGRRRVNQIFTLVPVKRALLRSEPDMLSLIQDATAPSDLTPHHLADGIAAAEQVASPI